MKSREGASFPFSSCLLRPLPCPTSDQRLHVESLLLSARINPTLRLLIRILPTHLTTLPPALLQPIPSIPSPLLPSKRPKVALSPIRPISRRTTLLRSRTNVLHHPLPLPRPAPPSPPSDLPSDQAAQTKGQPSPSSLLLATPHY
jgi:hypothetical protein